MLNTTRLLRRMLAVRYSVLMSCGPFHLDFFASVYHALKGLLARVPSVVEKGKGVFSRYPKNNWRMGGVRPRRNTPMRESNQRLWAMEELFGPDRLAEALRGKVREMIMTLAEAELAEGLGAHSYERSAARRGVRHGKRQRSISTGLGAALIELPRARISEGERDREWQSGLIARYQQRGASGGH